MFRRENASALGLNPELTGLEDSFLYPGPDQSAGVCWGQAPIDLELPSGLPAFWNLFLGVIDCSKEPL